MPRAPQPSKAGGISIISIACPVLAAQPGIAHGFFTRRGGVYASLNCAYGTGDQPENVLENIHRITHALGALKGLARAHQVHSATAIITDHPWPHDARPQADAVVTNTPGLAVGVTTADCLPILLADARNRVIAAAHAGWKGALSGIIEETLEAMQTLGASVENIAATIGPAIAQGSYEVGSEFYERFIKDDEANKQYFLPSARPIHPSPRRGEDRRGASKESPCQFSPLPNHPPAGEGMDRQRHYLFDLKAYAKDRLKACGVPHINVLAHDTCLEENDFFSYRRTTLRGEKAYGCQMSAIVLKE